MSWQDDPIIPSAASAWQSDPIVNDSTPSTQTESPSVLHELGRTAAMQTGEFVKGAASLLALPTDTIVRLINLGAGRRVMTPAAETIAAGIDSITPQPRNATERVTNAIVRNLGGATTGIGVGNAITGVVGSALAANPGQQLAASVTGAGAQQIAAEKGAGPIGQTVAGVAGALAPSVGSAALSGIARGAVRGGEAGRQAMADNIQAFQAAGTTSTVGQATQGRIAQATEALLSKTPGAAGRMVSTAQQQADQIGAKIGQIADNLAPQASGEQAGRAVTKGISGEGGFIDQFKAKQQQLYDHLDQHISQTAPVDVSNAQAALAKLNASIPGAPNISKFFKNAKISGINDALQADLNTPPPAADDLAKTLSKLDALRNSRNLASQEAGKFAAQANDEIGRANDFVPVPGQPRIPGRYSPFPARAADAAAAAQDATQIAQSKIPQINSTKAQIDQLQQIVDESNGKLPYQAVKQLRTLVGDQLSDWTMTSDVPRSKWKALYGALSSDLEGAAQAAGPDATAAWQRANNYTRAGMQRLDMLSSVIDKNGGPEAVYKAVTSGTREGATTLRAVMQSLPEEAQKTLSATVLRRLGSAKAGVQDDTGGVFSTETFLTNWNTMSPQAKAALFDRYGPAFRQNMDQIAKVASNLRDGSSVFKNPSGTGQAMAQIGAFGAFTGALFSHNLPVAGGIAGSVATSNLIARLMTNPNAVKWLATTTKAPLSAAPALLNRAAQSNDPDLKEFALQVRAEQGNQPDQQGNRK